MNVKSGVEVSPLYIEFGAVSRGDRVKRLISISGIRTEEVKDVSVQVHLNGELWNLTEQPVTVESAKSSKGVTAYSVELVHAGIQSGNVHGKLILKTADERAREIPVDFYAYFR